ncbi:THO complex subunit 4C-like [Wolffia australiana]
MDVSFDRMMSDSKRGRGRGGGRSWARGRRAGMPRQGYLSVNTRPSAYKTTKSFSRAKDLMWRPDLFNDSMNASGLNGPENDTKLYVSNLDYGVSNEDIKELFSEIGQLRRSTLHFDQNGRSIGSAEVVFVRRSDAVAALKRYNNVQLDGKAMKIEILGVDSVRLPVSAQVKVVGADGRGRRTVVLAPRRGGQIAVGPHRGRGRGPFMVGGRGRGGFGGRTGGRGGVRGRGRGRRQRPTEKSADDLDKELDSYHAEAMNTS